MSEIRIQYYGSIRAAAQKSEEQMDVSANMTVYQLLQQLDLQDELFESENKNIREDVTILINGNIINHEDTLDLNIQPGDIIALLPIFPGGG
ncbi:MAG: MoaD/ThiS family protein [Oscillospiraceae bacterium]|nr:MoaD/ThiS family protein [Oscillospiraceae bacterium]